VNQCPHMLTRHDPAVLLRQDTEGEAPAVLGNEFGCNVHRPVGKGRGHVL
jgi:hypothetical protein